MVGQALCAMIEYYGTERKMICNAFKVYGICRAVALREGLDRERMQILECAAILHNVGATESTRKFGCVKPEYMEILSARVAREILESLRFSSRVIEGVTFLVSHHRSVLTDGGISQQILLEAVMIAALDEGTLPERPSPAALREQIFRTRTGTELFNTMFGILPPPPVTAP